MARIGEFDTNRLIYVYQLHSTSHLIDEDAFCNAMRGKDVVKAWKKNLYEHRASVITWNLDKAFDIGNMYHEQLSWKHSECNSFSVGNIFHNIDDDLMYVCMPVGWEKLTMTMTMEIPERDAKLQRMREKLYRIKKLGAWEILDEG